MKNYGFQNKFVTFIDLLGFRGSIIDARNDVRELSKIKKKVKSLQDHFGANRKKAYPEFKVKVHAFSDCIVRERDYFKGGLYSEISSIAFGLIDTLVDGFLVRGALTHGLNYSNKKIIVSPAFLRAYELETKVANFPRIIIDSTTLAHYEERPDWGGDAHPHSEDKDYVYGLLIKDPHDGCHFIDYLNFAYRNADESGPEFLQHLLGIQKGLILQGLQHQSENIRKKYQWLGWYQNYVIDQHPDDWKNHFKKGWKARFLIEKRLL
jgi:hypothetical protein